MKRILVVESDEEQSQKLSAAIEARGEFTVSQAATLREAFLLIAQQPFDLALIPGTDVAAARNALHALQPELELAVIVPGEPVALDEHELGNLRGVLFTAAPDDGLQEILGDPDGEVVSSTAGTLSDAASEPELAETQVSTPAPSVEETIVTGTPQFAHASETGASVRRALESAVGSDEIVAGLVTTAGDITASSGLLKWEQVASIARRVNLTWHEGSTALLQFMRPPDRASDLLLFTRPMHLQQLLTLAAAPDANLGRLRRAADDVTRNLAGLNDTGGDNVDLPAAIEERAKVGTSEQASYALLFQPRRPLPAVLQPAVATALYDVAEEAGCNLHFQQVDAELVHVVTTCPPQRGSGWLARLYKKGVEERIQEQFGVSAHLWRKGFYATETELPLSDAELKLFADDQLE